MKPLHYPQIPHITALIKITVIPWGSYTDMLSVYDFTWNCPEQHRQGRSICLVSVHVCVCSFMSCLSFSKPLPMMSTSSSYADWSSASALECQWETVTRQTFLCQDQAEPHPETAKSYTCLAPRCALSYITICQRGTQIDTHLWHFTTSENTCFPTVIFNVHFSALDHQSLRVNPHAAAR